MPLTGDLGAEQSVGRNFVLLNTGSPGCGARSSRDLLKIEQRAGREWSRRASRRVLSRPSVAISECNSA